MALRSAKDSRDLGYVEGENLRIEARYADRHFDRLKPLAAELVGLNVELIVTAGPGVLWRRTASRPQCRS